MDNDRLKFSRHIFDQLKIAKVMLNATSGEYAPALMSYIYLEKDDKEADTILWNAFKDTIVKTDIIIWCYKRHGVDWSINNLKLSESDQVWVAAVTLGSKEGM